MSEEVADRIRALIGEEGPVAFDRFMDLALYSPDGFYDRPPVGREGHFVTSPHIHPVFGRLVGAALRDGWEALGRPRPFRVVEVGAGDGTLAASMLPPLEDVDVSYGAVERTVGARRSLIDRGLDATDDLAGATGEGFVGAIVANELLDNLPFRMVRRTADGDHRELLVDVDGSGFRLVEAPCPADLLDLTPALRPGDEGPVPVGALRLVERLAAQALSAIVLLIDYGSDATPGHDDDHPATPAAPVHGYRGHRATADVLSDPGSRDITAGVDLALIRRHAVELGLHAPPSVSQRSALLALGFREWDAEERRRQAALLSEGQGAAATRTWSERSRASTLVDRSALGALRWVVLLTPGLDEPAWLATARAIEAAEPAS